MAQIIREIRVDVSQPNVFQAIVAKQLDCNSRFLKITLVDFGVKIEVPETAKVTINANRPDGKSQSFMGVANNDGTITVPLAQWMLEVAGELKCDVSVINTTDNKRLTSTDFYVNVQEAANKSTDISENPDGEIRVITPTQKIDKNSSDDEYPSAKAVFDLDNITATATGSAITIDSAKAPLQNLKLFGKTTQNGTPTPDAPVPLVSVGDSGSFEVGVYGKNLIPYPYHSGASYTSNGVTFTADENGVITVNGTSTGNINYNLMMYKNVVANEDLYLANICTDKNIALVCYYKLDGKGTWTGAKIPKGANWLTCYLEIKSGVTINNATVKPMVSVGEKATEYEPYTKQTLTMPYTLRSLPNTDTEDTKDFTTGVKTQKVGKFDITSDLTFYANRYNEDIEAGWNSTFFFTHLNELGLQIDNNAVCDYFPKKECYNRNNIGFYIQSNIVAFRVPNSLLADTSTQALAIQSLKTWLSDKTITVLYELATPIETPLTETELNAYRHLMTNKGTTTILSEAEAEVDYYINKPNAQAIGNIHSQVNADYFKLQQAIITTGGSTL